MPDGRPVFSGAVEGLLDEAVLRRVIAHVGGRAGSIYGKKGKSHVLRRLGGYNDAARYSPWIVLVDLDNDAECAPPFKERLLPNPAPYMCFCVVVREVETWLLADRETLARFLAVRVSYIPDHPEEVESPKDTMVQLASRSRRSEIRDKIAPRPGSSRRVGPAYSSRLIQYVANSDSGWRPEVAAERSGSLERCLRRIREMMRLLSSR